MRILHIIDSGGMYGAEMMLINLASEQRKQGIVPVIASIGTFGCNEKDIEIESRRQKLTVKIFRMHPGPNPLGAFRIINYAKLADFDIIHSHGYKGNILLGFLPGNTRKLPVLTTMHGWTATSIFSKIKLYEFLDRLSLPLLDAVVVVNKNMLSLPFLRGNCKNRIHFISNGISVDSQPHTTLRKDIVQFCKGEKVIGAIGRLSTEKGFDILIDAFSQVLKQQPNLRLLIIGEGSQRKLLETKIAGLGLTRHVLMPGFVDWACHYLCLFKLLVIPSISEGLPITLLEAMREGVPVLASSVGGIPDALEHGNCGILVPPGDKDKLVTAIASSLHHKVYLNVLANKARIRFKKHYSSERMCNEYSDIYRKLIS